MSSPPNDDRREDLPRRAAVLAQALGQLPPDAVTLEALFHVAVSAAVAVTLDPLVARMLFEAKLAEYQSRWSAGRWPSRTCH
jgi:hypothetical protein